MAFPRALGYYRQYLKDFTINTKIWNRMKMDEDVQQAFVEMKKGLTMAPVLGHLDPNKPYMLDNNGSNLGMGLYRESHPTARP